MSELNLTGLDILVVEDDPILRKREAALLERLGADVSAVETLDAARRLLAVMSFDFALLHSPCDTKCSIPSTGSLWMRR